MVPKRRFLKHASLSLETPSKLRVSHWRGPLNTWVFFVAFFWDASASDRGILSTACSVQNFASGETILREGEVGEWMRLDLAGCVRLLLF